MSKLILPELAFWDSMFWPEGVPRYLEVEEERLHYSLVERWARTNESKPAIITKEKTLSFGEIHAKTRELSNLLRSDQKSKEGIVFTGSVLNRILVHLSAALAGCPVIVSEGGNAPLAEKSLKISDDDGERATQAPEGVVDDDNPNDVFFSFITQASDGRIACSKKGYLTNLLSYNAFLGLGSGSNLTVYSSLKLNDLFHVFACLARGATTILTSQESELSMFSSELSLRSSYLYADADELGKMESGKARSLGKTVAWTALFRETVRTESRNLKDFRLLDMYELPEIGVVFSNHPSWRIRSSIGIPITNVEARLLKQSSLMKSWFEGVIEAGQVKELAIGGPAFDSLSYEGNTNRKAVRLRRLAEGKNRWIALKEYAEMDENGIFYIRPFDKNKAASQ